MALAARTVVELTPYSSAMLRTVSPGSTVCTCGGRSWTGALAAGIASARPVSGEGARLASPTMLSQDKDRSGLNRLRAPGRPETRIVMGRILLMTSARSSQIRLMQRAMKLRICPAYMSRGNSTNAGRNFGCIAGISPLFRAQTPLTRGSRTQMGCGYLCQWLYLTPHSRRAWLASAWWPGLGRCA